MYTTGCTGTFYKTEYATCADHSGCTQTLTFYGSEMECMDCGASYSGSGAAHLEQVYHSATGQTFYFCVE